MMAKRFPGLTIDSGELSPEDPLRYVPQDKWLDLMRLRRDYLHRKLTSDCRHLVQFVDDARLMHSHLGFASPEAMIREGYQLHPESTAIAVQWLRLNAPDEAISLGDVLTRAQVYQQRDQQDAANESRQGQRTDLIAKRAEMMQQRDQADAANHRPNFLYNGRSDIQEVKSAPSGTSVDAALRRLRKDRVDLHARVLAGELTAHAAMVEAGFRKRRSVAPPSGLTRLRRDWQRATAEERDTFWHEISKDRT